MRRPEGEIMNLSTIMRRLPLAMAVFATMFTASPAFAKGNGKAKEKSESIGKHGREEGELPYGLERYKDKNGELPSGLEKKKDDDGHLTRGLEAGGSRTNSTSKATKSRK
jgi:hypothetical protein